MLFNYLRVALRNLRKNKSYVIINTLGLGIALACCITAYLLLAYNIEFNNFHDANMEKIFFFITILGALLSASGIFALASLNVIKRTKEIGIRKALGATVNNILGLLNREFVIVLLFAAMAGSMGAYYATTSLLSILYAYHISVGILPVVLCAAFISGIGIFTTSATILKAARHNPVDSLRTE